MTIRAMSNPEYASPPSPLPPSGVRPDRVWVDNHPCWCGSGVQTANKCREVDGYISRRPGLAMARRATGIA